MIFPLYYSGELIVSPDEFSAIKKLAFKCESELGFDDCEWINGLRIILGSRMPKLYTKVKIIVDWGQYEQKNTEDCRIVVGASR